MSKDFRQQLKESMEKSVCYDCVEKHPEMDMTSRICVHTMNSNLNYNYQQLFLRIISANDDAVSRIIQAETHKNGEPLQVQLLVNGVEISFVPFFKILHDQLQEMISVEAREQTKAIIEKYEEKFSELFSLAKNVTKELFPSKYSNGDYDND